MGVNRHLGFPSIENGLWNGVLEKRDSRESRCWRGSASVVMMGRCRVPMTPRWSRKVVWTVSVSTNWRDMRLGPHSVR